MYIEDPRITFRRNLRRILDAYREQTGYGLPRLSKMSGIGRTSFHDYLTGRRFPSPEGLRRLAELFELPVEVFFRR